MSTSKHWRIFQAIPAMWILRFVLSMNRSMAYWWPRRDRAEASVLSTAACDCSNPGIVRSARRALANIKCCHVFSFYAATYVFGDSGASPPFPHLAQPHCVERFTNPSAKKDSRSITACRLNLVDCVRIKNLISSWRLAVYWYSSDLT